MIQVTKSENGFWKFPVGHLVTFYFKYPCKDLEGSPGYLLLLLLFKPLSGDSGGPLSVEQRRADDYTGPTRRVLIGVVSTLGAQRCTQNVPDKFTAVTKYLDWIKGSCGMSQAMMTTHAQAAFGGHDVYPHEHPWQVKKMGEYHNVFNN